MTQGWAFLVARGRRAGYRTVLAPAFLIDENEHHVLAESTGGGNGCESARVVELANALVGPFSIGYTSERLARADVEAGADGGELLTDEHGRPLEIVYGVVSRDRLDEPPDAADLRTARAHALQSYRRFLADEQGHRVEASEPLSLHTGGRARTVGAPAPAHAVACTPEDASAPASAVGQHRRRRAPGGRAVGAIAVAIGAALVVAGSLIVSSGSQEGSVLAASPAWLEKPPSGVVRFCTGEVPPNSQLRSQSEYNRRFSDSKVVLVRTRTTAAVAPHDRYLRNSDACDVISLDVIYTAEFAAKRLLYDMTPYLTADRRADFDDQILKTTRYEGRLWGVPKQFDAGVLFYRADRVRAPRSWRDVYRQARRRSPDGLPGLRLARGSSEGLTVVFLELAYAAGARPIVSPDGETADVDQPQVLEALRFMRDAILAAARIRDDASGGRARRRTAVNTKIVPLPPWNPGGQSIGVLGGHNLVIPRSARNPSAALHLIAFLTSIEQVRRDQRDGSQLPVLRGLADDPAPGNRALLSAIKATKVVPRPSIPRYAAVSRIISAGVEAALDGPADLSSSRVELRTIDREVQRVLDSSP